MAYLQLVFVCLVAVLTSASVAGQSKPLAPSIDPALQKAMDERRAARIAKDITTWERVTADDTIEVHSDGRVHTKAEEIAEIKAGTFPKSVDSDVKVRVYGSTAVYTAQRNPPNGPFRIVTVWVKNANGQWQAVLTQQTAVVKK